MINHGLSAMLAATSNIRVPNLGLVDPFGETTSWRAAVKTNLLCDAP